MYAPLQLIAKSDQPGQEFESRRKQFVDFGVVDDITEDEYINFFLSDDFLNLDYKGRFRGINTILFQNSHFLVTRLGIPWEEFETKHVDPVTEWRDIWLAPIVIERWAKNKQVFKPDQAFASALLSTEKLELSKFMVEHLPCDCFYIDLMNCKEYEPIIGIFVLVSHNEMKVDIVTYLLTVDLVYFSFYTGGLYDENGIIKLDYSNLASRQFEIYSPDLPDSARKRKYKADRKAAHIFALQMVAYLSSKEPQIDESLETKGTYKKPNPINPRPKNKFSEVQMWDVGVRYGTSFRKQMKEYQQRETVPIGHRKSPAPHFRCAHWHKYWTGEGRTKCEVRWIEPTFVGGIDRAKDVVVHTV